MLRHAWGSVLADIRRHAPKPVLFVGQLRWSIGVMQTTGEEVLVDTVGGLPHWVLRVPRTLEPFGLWALFHTVLREAGVTYGEVVSKGRSKPVVAARRAFVIAAKRDLTQRYSYPEISMLINRRSHTTARTAHKRKRRDLIVERILARLPAPWGTRMEVRS